MIVPHIEIPVSSLKDGLSFYQALLGIRPQVLGGRGMQCFGHQIHQCPCDSWSNMESRKNHRETMDTSVSR